jgi:hypothetical protein
MKIMNINNVISSRQVTYRVFSLHTDCQLAKIFIISISCMPVMKSKNITTAALLAVLAFGLLSMSVKPDLALAFSPKHCSTNDDGETSCSGGSGNGEGGSGGHCTTSSTESTCSGGQGSSGGDIDPRGGFGGHSSCDFATGACDDVGGGSGGKGSG